MASEYLKWKYRDVKPDAPVELTPQQKRANWWHYHKWHVILGVLLLIMGLDIARSALNIGETLPDFRIAYVGESRLPDDTVTALEQCFAQLAEDANGDGETVVKVIQYNRPDTDSETGDAYYAYASGVKLMADLENRESCFFLLDAPEMFQENYAVLANEQGELTDLWESAFWYDWTDCPVLMNMPLGEYHYDLGGGDITGENQSLLEGLAFARRGYWGDRTGEHPEATNAFWERLTEGAEK